MLLSHRARAAAAAALLSLPLEAQAADFAQTVTFGDSLTSNWLLGFPFRTALYGKDPMQAAFDHGAAAGDHLTDYAVPGAESSLLLAEIGVYAARWYAGTQGLGTLFSVEIGGNDLLGNWDRLSSSPPGADPYADAVIDRLIHRLGSDLGLLWSTHPGARFVVWTLPDLTCTPRHWADRTTVRGANFRAHLARVNALLRLLALLPNVVVLDTETLVRSYALNPPSVHGRQLVGPPAFGVYDGLFADAIHPTAVGNALVANAIILLVDARWNAGVPLYTEDELALLARIP